MHTTVRFLLFVSVTFLISSCDSGDSFEKIDPEVNWETPAPIGVGVPLGENQLNATADVAGTYTYSPDSGTVLEEGLQQELNVLFTPKYPSAFNEVNLSVMIDVVNRGSSNANFNQNIEYGIVADIDGNAYKTVTIGGKTWMAENLRTTKYQNGDDITLVTNNSEWVNRNAEAYSSYSNTEDLDERATYGLLYNWQAVSDSRNIAPEGWHVATQADWEALIAVVGNGDNAGGRLREAGSLHWNGNNTSTNPSGFTALPGGRRQYTDGTFINQGFNAFFWSATANGPDFAFYYQVNYDSSPIVAANFLKAAGYSVRCVKND